MNKLDTLRSSEPAPQMEAPKRVNFCITSRAHRELSNLSRRHNQSITSLILNGLGLIRLALDSRERGERLVIVDASGVAIKEIVLPGF